MTISNSKTPGQSQSAKPSIVSYLAIVVMGCAMFSFGCGAGEYNRRADKTTKELRAATPPPAEAEEDKK